MPTVMMIMMVGAFLCLVMMACGTGIEVTDHVTDKDVRRVIDQIDSKLPPVTLEPYVDSVPSWKAGKRFWVADDQARLVFVPSADVDFDTLNLKGRVLNYDGFDTGGIYDNRQTVNLRFMDSVTGVAYVYRTGKTMSEFRSAFSIPMLIDLDLVDLVARQIADKDFYIRTPIWYERSSGQMIGGRHYIKVHIDSVLPGNAVMPLRVLFTTADSHEPAMVWMSDNASTMHGRDFDALFVAGDPRQVFPDITDENWLRITCGQVVEGMTKEECRLALGAPKRINEMPEQAGMREYWYYDGGSYLFFVDGLLRQYRK